MNAQNHHQELLIRAVRAYNHDLRQKIMKYIRENPDAPVKEIYATLKIEQSVASQHLEILREANLVKSTRDGKFQKYVVNDDKIDLLNTLSRMWALQTQFLGSPSLAEAV